jgi:two-component system OmpR family sensor kinase
VMRGIEEEATRMSRLVDELLLLARLDQGRTLPPGEVDLTSVARSAVEAARASEPERPLTLRGNGPVLVDGDGDRLRQVFDNLLGNVRVHTPAGTPATVRVGATDGMAEIEVEDRGPGIPGEAAAHVFERFYRVDAGRSRHRGGHGLGLSIVAAIAEAHGGSCAVTPGAEGGTVVAVRLPARSDQADGAGDA